MRTYKVHVLFTQHQRMPNAWVGQYVGDRLSRTDSSLDHHIPSLPSLPKQTSPSTPKRNFFGSDVDKHHCDTHSEGAYIVSVTSVNSGGDIKRKFVAPKFNSKPIFTWHWMPPHTESVVELMSHLSLVSRGCGCVPASLKDTLESASCLATESFPRFCGRAKRGSRSTICGFRAVGICARNCTAYMYPIWLKTLSRCCPLVQKLLAGMK